MKKETEYRRGAEDTMQAYIAFGKKQEAAIQHASEQIGTVSATVSQIQNDVNGIIDYAIDSEKRGKLGLSAQRSITDLEKTDADYLVATLMQLAKEEGGNLTTLQQNYMSSVQRCLGITAPQPGIVLEGIESIDDVQAQKIILQTVLEFWRLGDKPQDFNEARESFLDCFQLNGKAKREVAADVESMFQFLGANGVAFRYAPAAQSSDNDETVCAGQEYTVDDDVRIMKGQRKIYQDAVVHMNANILCEGELCFKNCEIHYHEFGGKEEIKIGQTGSLSMYRCTVVCHGCGERAFIDSEDAQESVSFEKCQFNDCANFVKGGTLVFEGCRMNTPSHLFVECSDGTVKFSNCEMIIADLTYGALEKNEAIAVSGRECILSECSVKRNTPHESENDCLRKVFDVKKVVAQRCVASMLEEIYFIWCRESASVMASRFTNCRSAVHILDDGMIEDCQFIDCSLPLSTGSSSTSSYNIVGCRFVGGDGMLIECSGNLKMKSCTFDGWSSRTFDSESREMFYMRYPMINIYDTGFKKGKVVVDISDCLFLRMSALGSPLFGCDLGYTPDGIRNLTLPIQIKGCTFADCKMRLGENILSFYIKYMNGVNNSHKKISCSDKTCRVIKGGSRNSCEFMAKAGDGELPAVKFVQGEVGARLSKVGQNSPAKED